MLRLLLQLYGFRWIDIGIDIDVDIDIDIDIESW